jgi:hypothetical protein
MTVMVMSMSMSMSMSMEQRGAGETKVLRENLLQCLFVTTNNQMS